MSWQLAPPVLLGLVLAGGFAWYERSRPSARLLALVAALAALAVAGRIVLAPIPNVVATTDVVLFAGYVLGGAPGFVVGALAALVSNFWLGQGPWTVWQMAGWGLVGLGGAALAAGFGRDLGRFKLALAAALAGLAYGALLDLSVMVNFGGEQSLDRYLALSARGIPFNLAHAVGNAAFALVAGPAFIRMLARFRDRATIVWLDRPASGAVALLAGLAVSMAAFSPARAEAQDTGAAATYLEASQNGDGGFGADPGGRSSVGMTGWASLGLISSGINPADVRSGGRSALGYLEAHVAALDSIGDLERTILVVAGSGADPASFGGRDLAAELNARRSKGGSYGGQVNLTAYGILALEAAGAPGSEIGSSAAWLRKHQNKDGGWGFAPGAGSDPDSTGAVLEALAVSPGEDGALRAGAGYLRRTQRPKGGWTLANSTSANSQSTALALQGLIAAGASPSGITSSKGTSGLDYLAARQAPDGSFRYSQSGNQTVIWVTAQALMASNRQALPLAAAPRAPKPERNREGSDESPVDEGSSDGGGAKKTAKPEAKPGRERSAKKEAAATRVADREGDPERPSIADQVAAVRSSNDDGSGSAVPIVIGLLALALILLGGFFVYQRRLPPPPPG